LKVVLDTHVWVWWLLASLADRERLELNRIAGAGGIHLPAICLWEAQMLYSKGRIKLPSPFSTWIRPIG
jgi:PIN domain nuclease of toxin-antitoxin system